jgi:hypothetical protein
MHTVLREIPPGAPSMRGFMRPGGLRSAEGRSEAPPEPQAREAMGTCSRCFQDLRALSACVVLPLMDQP